MTARIWPADAVTGAPSYTGRSLRQTQVAVALGGTTSARPLGGLSGVRPSTPNTIATATSTTWTVTPFAGSIDGEALAIAGPYLYSFDANVTGSVTAAAGSARVDRLDVQVSDPAESDGSANPGIAIVYNAGVPGSGVPVAAPARSHPLALINVPASGGGSPTVTWNANYTASAGGILQCTSSTTYPTAATYPGLYVDDLTLGLLLRSNGTTWVPVTPLRAELKYTGAGQSIPNGANTVITYDGTDYYNNLPAFTYTRASGTLTCTRAGTYEFDGVVVLATSATGIRQLSLSKALAATPTTFVIQSTVTLSAAAGAFQVSGVWKLTLAVGDVIVLQVAQSSGGALNVTGVNLAVAQMV